MSDKTKDCITCYGRGTRFKGQMDNHVSPCSTCNGTGKAEPSAPTVEERRTVRLDNEGVEWVACDPYPTWYRRVHGELLTLDSLGDDFCGWPAPTVDGWVWCETCKAPQFFHVEDGDYECGRWSDESCGPYHRLLIGQGFTT
jgi:hypothetical protein